MFNFKVMNRALNDSNLSDKAFRMLYTITNYSSLKDSNSVEIHNAHFMMVLNISERWVQKITNELVEKGYITKTINGTSKNKLANTYTLIEVEENESSTDLLCNDINGMTQKDAQKFAQKFTLKNNNKINKNISIADNIYNSLPVEEINDGLDCIFEDNYNVTSTDTGFAIADKIELRSVGVCDSDEQREEEITNDIEVINTDNFNAENDNTNYENISDINMNNEMTSTLADVLNEQSQIENEVLAAAKSVSRFDNDTQKRYTNLFKRTKTLIEEWYNTHDNQTKSFIESNIKVIGWMYSNGDISVKQWQTAQEKLQNHFNKIYNGWCNLKKSKPVIKSYAPAPVANENKAVLSHVNNADNKSIGRHNETQQDANKRANFRYYSRVEQKRFEQLINIGGSQDDLKEVVEYIKCEYNGYPAGKMEKLYTFINHSVLGCDKFELYEELKDYIRENINV